VPSSSIPSRVERLETLRRRRESAYRVGAVSSGVRNGRHGKRGSGALYQVECPALETSRAGSLWSSKQIQARERRNPLDITPMPQKVYPGCDPRAACERGRSMLIVGIVPLAADEGRAGRWSHRIPLGDTPGFCEANRVVLWSIRGRYRSFAAAIRLAGIPSAHRPGGAL
jgi:hypothetical protein